MCREEEDVVPVISAVNANGPLDPGPSEESMEESEEIRSTPIEDAKLAIEIFKKSLEYRPLIRPAIVGDEYRALPNDEQLREMLTPRIGLAYADEKKTIPCLFFRFVGDESPIVEAFFYPYEAILSFLSEARNFARWVSSADTDEEGLKKIAFEQTIDMTIIMLDHFYRRSELMMDSFISEVIIQWRLQNSQRAIQYRAEHGESLPKRKDKSLDSVITQYTKQIIELWKWQGQTADNLRKLQLAKEYDAIYRHWKRLSEMIGDEDWREYAKPKKFHDTPDDLLDKLENIDRSDKEGSEYRLSELAIEHAARRAGLIKKHGVNSSILGRRKKGLKVSGYSSGHLFKCLKYGRELLARLEEQEELLARERQGTTPQPGDESAQSNRAKSFEQKIVLIQAESDNLPEQNRHPVKEHTTTK